MQSEADLLAMKIHPFIISVLSHICVTCYDIDLCDLDLRHLIPNVSITELLASQDRHPKRKGGSDCLATQHAPIKALN